MTAAEQEFRTLMDGTGLNYQLNEAGNAMVHFTMANGRTQLVLVSQDTDEYIKGYRDHDVMSAIARVEDLPQDFKVLVKLLEIIATKKMGGLVIVGDLLLYRVDVSVRGGSEDLEAGIRIAASVADELEAALTKNDDY